MTARWPRPDFLATSPKRPALAWAWAAAGVLALGVTATEGLAQKRLVDTQGARLAKAEQRAARAAPTPIRAQPATAPTAQVDAALAARRIMSRIDHPWDQILANIEAETPPGLQWRMFDHDSSSPEVRLEGMAPDAATALQLVDVLSARAGWSDVSLSRLQAPDAREAAATGPAWRFELRAVIDARRVAAARNANAG